MIFKSTKMKNLNKNLGKSQLYTNLGKSQLYTGFSLAEVLITLGIIGVVAAMTIPTLIKNVQEEQFKQAWKKQYSVISQATQLMIADNGGTISGLCISGDLVANSDCIGQEYLKYLVNVKSYVTGISNASINRPSYKFLNGADALLGCTATNFYIILNDGATYNIYRFDQFNGGITVDVNGNKLPNVAGRDLFRVWLKHNGIKPAGFAGDTYPYTMPGTEDTYGLARSAKYLYE